jgi:hypothetical protein
MYVLDNKVHIFHKIDLEWIIGDNVQPKYFKPLSPCIKIHDVFST